MNTPNGDDSTLLQNATTTSPSAPSKRKRSESDDQHSSNPKSAPPRQATGFAQRLQNALPLLHKADQSPSVLHHQLTLNGEPSLKRLKYATENPKVDTISARIESKSYENPEALLEDVDAAVRSLVQGLENGGASADPASVRKAVNQITLFKQSLGKVCRHIATSETREKPAKSQNEEILPAPPEQIPRPAILTLTSQTERGPKQLYSGLQCQPAGGREYGEVLDALPARGSLGLETRRLPNGISAAEAASCVPFDQADPTKTKRKFGDIFQPHRSIKALEPPRPSRNSTRSSSLGWVGPAEHVGYEKPTPTYRSDHRYTSLPTGSWLHYGNPETSTGRSPDNKRRKIERALSIGDGRADDPQESIDHQQARATAVFQSAYSSFAPASDNSTAVVSEKTRNRVWWNTVGQRRFQSLILLQYPESARDDEVHPVFNLNAQADDDFEAMVANFEEVDGSENAFPNQAEAIADPKGVDDVLQEVSDLLQTLSSYQRIRNLAKIDSGPNTPSSAEQDVYEVLRSSLVVLVDSLPPYAVAKLNGEQLEALNVNTSLVMGTKDYAGTLEIDEVGLQRQRASLPATQPASTRSNASTYTAGRQGIHSAPSIVHGDRPSLSNTPRTPHGSQPRPVPAYVNTSMPQKQGQSPARPGPVPAPGPRPNLSKPQYYSDHVYGSAANTASFPRPSNALQNGTGTPYGNANQQRNALGYAPKRHPQLGLPYPPNQSPQRAGRRPRSSFVSEIHQHAQKQQPANTAAQASPSMVSSSNSSITMTEQARAQLQAHRQLASTPPRTNMNGRYGYGPVQQTAPSPTPVGGVAGGIGGPGGSVPAVASQSEPSR